MEPRNFSSMATMATTPNPKKPSIVENMSDLRKTLSDINGKLDELTRILFGSEPQEAINPNPSCLEEDVCMTKALALSIMNKLCSIQEKL